MAAARSTRRNARPPLLQTSAGAPLPSTVPLLPIREGVYFPNTVFPIFVGREASMRAIEEARAGDRCLLLVTQRERHVDNPESGDLYEVGTLVEILQVHGLPDGTARALLEGKARARIAAFEQIHPMMRVRVELLTDPAPVTPEVEALARAAVETFEQIVEADGDVPAEVIAQVTGLREPEQIADSLASHIGARRPAAEIQKLLEMVSLPGRLKELIELLRRELQVLEIQRTIRSNVEREMSETQRQHILREQLKAIQQEIQEGRILNSEEEEDLEAQIENAALPEPVLVHARRECRRLREMSPSSPEVATVRNYLDLIVALPWTKATPDNIRLKAAEKDLDADHHGLRDIKDRILEFLAVRKLSPGLKGPILCFAGPPGVGKTSLGRSIARAMGRKFVRVSLGGVTDEAEIRGHRRTYVAAMPGRIIQGMRTAGSRNPVFLLDEIDKLGSHRGDPSAALLEALDPEQNCEFSDHYLEVPFDLSQVMFITTANMLDTVPPALRDRLEVIQFPGYTETEKLSIARSFLVPKQLKEHGLEAKHLSLTEGALVTILREHTREAGVRHLERAIATICRKTARRVAGGEGKRYRVDAADVAAYLGRRRYIYGRAETGAAVGAATGLAYTEHGGDIMTVEASLLPFHELKLTLTGHLGAVMRESATAALSYVRSRSRAMRFDAEALERREIHIHVPEGAVPKDGPSAGVTMAIALTSALTGRPARPDVAMTGEITLRGRVLSVGGIKDKVLAAHRAGLKAVILPAENERDLDDIPAEVRDQLAFHLVEHMDQVIPLVILDAAPSDPPVELKPFRAEPISHLPA